jgi:hypothetical protein
MNRSRSTLAVAAMLAVACAALHAQTTVYESRDKGGAVFSDKPAPGASAVDLPSANVLEMPKPEAVITPAPVQMTTPYRSLTFASLEQGATVHSNTGAFDFTVRATPFLRPGDHIRVRLDGTLLAGSYRSINLHLSEADWRRAARSSSVEHSLQVSIVDDRGQVLVTSPTIRFFVHRAAVGGRN